MLRKTVSCCLLGAFLLAVVLNTGCGGGGGGGSSPFFAGLATFVLIVAATGGAAGSAAAFAANVRTSPRPAIVAQTNAQRIISILQDKLKVRIFPLRNGQAVGSPQVIPSGNLIVEGDQLKGQSNVEYTEKEYRVEVVSGDAEVVLLKGIQVVESLPADKTVNAPIDPLETAKAVTYEKWVADSPEKSFAAFKYNLDKTAGAVASITKLADTIQTTLANHTGSFTTSILESPDIQEQAQANAAAISKDSPPNTVPESKNIVEPVDEPTTQVKYAIFESTNTGLTGLPLRSLRTQAAPAAPGIVPVFGGNTAVDLEGMKNIFMAALTGGSTVTDGPGIDDPEAIVATFTGTALSIEHYRFNYTSNANPPYIRRPYPAIRRVLSNIQATKTGDVVTKVQIGPSSILEVEEFEDLTGKLLKRTIFKIVSGISAVIEFKEYANGGTFYPNSENSSWEYRYSKSASETYTVTFPSSFILEFEEQVYENNKLDEAMKARVNISGISGQITATTGFLYGAYYFNNQPSNVPFSSKVNFDVLNSDGGFDNLTLSRTVTIAASGNTSSGISLTNLSITLNNLQRKGSNKELDFTCSNSSISIQINYFGSAPEEFGYIKSLGVAISNLGIDTTKEMMVLDGTTFAFTKVNTDNTTDTINYIIQNGDVALTSANTKFGGGRETVTKRPNGDLEVKGTVSLSNADGKKVTMTYTALRSELTTDIMVSLTMSGSVKGSISFTLTPENPNSLISNGSYQAGGLSGSFTLDKLGIGTLIIGGRTDSFALSGMGWPLASLRTFQ